jgi:hypothetical protein
MRTTASVLPEGDVELASVFEFSASSAQRLLHTLLRIRVPARANERTPEQIKALAFGPVAGVLEGAGATIRLLKSMDELLASDAATQHDDIELELAEAPEVALADALIDLDDAFSRLCGEGGATPTLLQIRDTGALIVPELRQGLRQLKTAYDKRAVLDMLTEAEELRRKCLSGLRRVMGLMAALQPERAPDPVTQPRTDVEQSLLVRELLLGFGERVREQLRGLDEMDERELTLAAIRVDREIFALLGSPMYAHVRAPDRAHIEGLQARMQRSRLAREWREPASAVLKDLLAFVELLRLVNNRECLIVHDRALRDRCLGELRDIAALWPLSPVEAQRKLREVLSAVLELRWRDPQLGRASECEVAGDERRSDALLADCDALATRLAALSF